MMEAQLRVLGGRLTIKLQGDDVKTLFQEIAQADEIFAADTECGCCQSNDIKFVVRHVDSFLFHELRCSQCHASLSFGQTKSGGLFPKRKDAAGDWSQTRGWSKYEAAGGY